MSGLILPEACGYVRASRTRLLARLQEQHVILASNSPLRADLPLTASHGAEEGRHPDPEIEFQVPPIDVRAIFNVRDSQEPPWNLTAKQQKQHFADLCQAAGITGIHATLWLISEHLERYGTLPGVTRNQKELTNPEYRIDWSDRRTSEPGSELWGRRFESLDATSWVIRTSTPVPGHPGSRYAVSLYSPMHNGLYLNAVGKKAHNCMICAFPSFERRRRK